MRQVDGIEGASENRDTAGHVFPAPGLLNRTAHLFRPKRAGGEFHLLSDHNPGILRSKNGVTPRRDSRIRSKSLLMIFVQPPSFQCARYTPGVQEYTNLCHFWMHPVYAVPGCFGKSVVLPRFANCCAIRAGLFYCRMHPVHPVPGCYEPRQKRGFASVRELLRNSGRPSMAGVRERPWLLTLPCLHPGVINRRFTNVPRTGNNLSPYPYMLFFLEGGSGGKPFSLGFQRKGFPPTLPSPPTPSPVRCRRR